MFLTELFEAINFKNTKADFECKLGILDLCGYAMVISAIRRKTSLLSMNKL